MKNIDFLKTWPIAHRGLHNYNNKIIENSIEAYQLAIKNKIAIELDITVLKDGTVVCFHDKNLERVTGINKFVYDVSYDDIKDVTLLNSNSIIPKFINVLNLVNNQVPLLVEIKSHKNYEQALPIIGEMISNYHGEIAIFSFSPKIVMWFKKHYPNIIRGQITSSFSENKKMIKPVKYLLKSMFFNRFTNPDFISYHSIDLPNKYADKAKNAGLTVISYTAFNYDEYLRVKNLYDNIVFEGFIIK